MGKLSAVISCLLVTIEAVTAQAVHSSGSDRPLPQWLTGIIAVCCFLFLAFVSVLVKKAWCDGSHREKSSEGLQENHFDMSDRNAYDTRLDSVRCKEDLNAYDNLVIDETEAKVTPM